MEWSVDVTATVVLGKLKRSNEVTSQLMKWSLVRWLVVNTKHGLTKRHVDFGRWNYALNE